MSNNENGAAVSGTVTWKRTDQPIQGAIVVAISDDGERVVAQTDSLGAFCFDPLESDGWSVVALHEKARTGHTVRPDLTGGKVAIEFQLVPSGHETVDPQLGRRFVTGLIIGLVALFILYGMLHIIFPGAPTPLSESLDILIDQTNSIIGASDSSGEGALPASLVKGIKTHLERVLAERTDISEVDRNLMNELAATIEEAVRNDRPSELAAGLETLRALVHAYEEVPIFWSGYPLILIEVAFFALAGVLVLKIIECSTFLRWNRFYREGVPMHLAHIVTTPLLVIIAVLLLSLATFQITLVGGTEVSLDLSNPTIMLVLAFSLGASPWSLWEFIKSTAEKVIGGD